MPHAKTGNMTMRSILLTSLFGVTFALAAPALAKGHGYNTTISAPLTSAVKIEIVLSDDMAHRANNLPEKLSERSNARSLNAGFSGNGFYGDRDLEYLKERLYKKLERRFTKKNIQVSDTAQTVLRVTIVDARPNRPTFEQLKKEVNLSFSSFAIGGAELEAELIAADGDIVGSMSYEYYEDDIRFINQSSTWNDAYKSFDRFSRRAAKTLSSPK
ncbi:hypothetical protein N9W89_10845 [Hellea sp.]|nr:hypothetical protein [Hellea sp.]